jgi:hypothetical protein
MRWVVTTKADPIGCQLRDRHYPPRRAVGSRQFLPPGETLALVLVHRTGAAVWGACHNVFREVWRWRVSIFRNESRLLSSSLVEDGTGLTYNEWRTRYSWPGLPLRTEVDASRVRPKAHPGRCFLEAGWRYVETIPAGHGRTEKLVFEAPARDGAEVR